MSTKNDNIMTLNTINFEPYLSRHRDLTAVVWDVEADYELLPTLAATNGDLLSAMTLGEFSTYLSQRYPAWVFYYEDGTYMCKPLEMTND